MSCVTLLSVSIQPVIILTAPLTMPLASPQTLLQRPWKTSDTSLTVFLTTPTIPLIVLVKPLITSIATLIPVLKIVVTCLIPNRAVATIDDLKKLDKLRLNALKSLFLLRSRHALPTVRLSELNSLPTVPREL